MDYHYQNVCLEDVACTLPEEVVTSDQIERQLEPLYSRLRLPEGRLELMSGIAERRVWPEGMLARRKEHRNGREGHRPLGHRPATLRRVGPRIGLPRLSRTGHGLRRPPCLGLPRECTIYDVSNACLGLLNGMLQVANMIELGQIRAGVVVGTESSRALMETTIRQLNADTSLSRKDIKSAIASLTIGSGSAAIVLAHRDLSRTGNRLLGGVASAATEFCHLCRSGRDEAASDGMKPLMATDAETLMLEGVATAKTTFRAVPRRTRLEHVGHR